MFDIRKSLITVITIGLTGGLSYGVCPSVKKLLMRLTDTVEDKETGKLSRDGNLNEVFENALNTNKVKKGWELLGKDKGSPFKYTVGNSEYDSIGFDDKIFDGNEEWKDEIYKALLSEGFAKALLGDEFIDAFYGVKGSQVRLVVSDKLKQGNGNTTNKALYDFSVEYYQQYYPQDLEIKFGFTYDPNKDGGKITDNSVRVGCIRIPASGYYFPGGGHDDLLDELGRIIEREEDWALKNKSARWRRRLYWVSKASPFATKEPLKTTFKKYPTPDVLLGDLKCSDKDWDNCFRNVYQYFRQGESQYAGEEICLEFQKEAISLNGKGIPNVSGVSKVPEVKANDAFKRACEVLLSVDFATALLGDCFMNSFLKADGDFKPLISVDFEKHKNEEGVFDFNVTYHQKKIEKSGDKNGTNVASSKNNDKSDNKKGVSDLNVDTSNKEGRVWIAFNVTYDTAERRFKGNENGDKVRILHFWIGEFGIVPLNEVLRSEDLRFCASYFLERLENIRKVLFDDKKHLFTSLVSESKKQGWMDIRRSVSDVVPYVAKTTCTRMVPWDYEDHMPEGGDGCCNISCDCHSTVSIFDFMCLRKMIGIKDLFTDGCVVLCKNGEFEARKDGERIWNCERDLISRKNLMESKDIWGSGLEPGDWTLLGSSVFMVGLEDMSPKVNSKDENAEEKKESREDPDKTKKINEILKAVKGREEGIDGLSKVLDKIEEIKNTKLNKEDISNLEVALNGAQAWLDNGIHQKNKRKRFKPTDDKQEYAQKRIKKIEGLHKRIGDLKASITNTK